MIFHSVFYVQMVEEQTVENIAAIMLSCYHARCYLVVHATSLGGFDTEV